MSKLNIPIDRMVVQWRVRYERLLLWQKHLVWGVTLGVALLMFTALILLPMQQWYQEQFQRWQQAVDNRRWLQSQEPKAALLRQYREQGKSSDISLLSLATNSAKTQELTISRYEPRDDSELVIWMEQVPYLKVMAWLRKLLAEDSALRIRSLSLRTAEQSGTVSVNLELTR